MYPNAYETDAARHAKSRLIVADALVRWGVVDGCVAGAKLL